MRIAILGGTGDIGEGLALRWGLDTDHKLIVGSRDPQKARQHATANHERIREQGSKGDIAGVSNTPVGEADVVLLSAPPEYVLETIETVAGSLFEDMVVVSPAISMSRGESGFHYEQPEGSGGVTAIAEKATPDGIPDVGAFHNISADRLTNLDTELDVNTIVVGDGKEAKYLVKKLADEIKGLRAIGGGDLANAPKVERATPLLINIAMNNKEMNHLGVRSQ